MDPANNNDKYIDNYLADLLKKAGADKLPPEYQLALKAELFTEIEKRLRVASLEALENKDQNLYAELLESRPTLEEQVKFFNYHIKNFSELLVKTLDEVEQEYLAKVNSL